MNVLHAYVLDTGPLFDHLIRTYQDDSGVDFLHDVVKHLKTAALHEQYREALEARPGHLHVTSGVVAELQFHGRKAGQKSVDSRAFLEIFWDLVASEFQRLQVEERAPLRLLEMDEDLLKRHGPVDLGIRELARTFADGPRPATVVTGDGALYQACHGEVPVVYPQDVSPT